MSVQYFMQNSKSVSHLSGLIWREFTFIDNDFKQNLVDVQDPSDHTHAGNDAIRFKDFVWNKILLKLNAYLSVHLFVCLSATPDLFRNSWAYCREIWWECVDCKALYIYRDQIGHYSENFKI